MGVWVGEGWECGVCEGWESGCVKYGSVVCEGWECGVCEVWGV